MTEENENTYLFDTESAVEMGRLVDQERVITQAMGGPLSGVLDLPAQAQILDLGCGPGGWVLDAAYANPESEVAGVDISKIMIGYANARARTQGLTNASFGLMDITQPLEFPTASFDLVNARLLVAVLQREAWEPFLRECTRILRPGGTIRLTEPVEPGGMTNSSAYERVNGLMAQLLRARGYAFSVDDRTHGMALRLPRMLRDLEYQHVHLLSHALEISSGCPAWSDMYRNAQAMSAAAMPLFPQETHPFFQHFLQDMRSPDFCGTWHFDTVIGIKPLRGDEGEG